MKTLTALFCMVFTLFSGMFAWVSPAFARDRVIEVHYQLSKDGLPVGEISETYTQTGDQYRIESETKGLGVYALIAKGSIKMISTGNVIKSGLQPVRFEHHKGKNGNKIITADFDWTEKKLTMKQGDEVKVQALPRGTQDRLSLMYQFMFYRPAGRSFQFDMTNGRKVDRYRYRLVNKETLTTPVGAIRTAHFRKEKHQADDDGADLWLATGAPYLPVRLTIVESNGLTLQQDVKRWDLR